MIPFRFFRPAERRLKVVTLSPHDVLAALCWQENEFLMLLDMTGLPEGSEVVSVHADELPRCFRIVVYNSSFDLVPEGERPPELTLSRQAIKLRRAQGDTYTVEAEDG
jgi:hypothetical protein